MGKEYAMTEDGMLWEDVVNKLNIVDFKICDAGQELRWAFKELDELENIVSGLNRKENTPVNYVDTGEDMLFLMKSRFILSRQIAEMDEIRYKIYNRIKYLKNMKKK